MDPSVEKGAGYGEHLNVAKLYELPKPYRVGPVKVPSIYHPRVQLLVLSMAIFSTVGMYTVLVNIGGAGQATAELSDKANIALYTVFLVFCLVAPGCLTYFGMRKCLVFGIFG